DSQRDDVVHLHRLAHPVRLAVRTPDQGAVVRGMGQDLLAERALAATEDVTHGGLAFELRAERKDRVEVALDLDRDVHDEARFDGFTTVARLVKELPGMGQSTLERCLLKTRNDAGVLCELACHAMIRMAPVVGPVEDDRAGPECAKMGCNDE